MQQRSRLRLLILIELAACILLAAILFGVAVPRALNRLPTLASTLAQSSAATRVAWVASPTPGHGPLPTHSAPAAPPTNMATLAQTPTRMAELARTTVIASDTLAAEHTRSLPPASSQAAASPAATATARTLTPTTAPTSKATPSATATASPSPTIGAPTATPTIAVHYPAYISGITSQARQIFLSGQGLGDRAHAFSLVGDSNTDNPAFFAPFDLSSYDLGPYGYLQDTIYYFGGSFARDSAAAVGGFSTAKVLDPAYADASRCQPGESPLACEYRLQRPCVALILLGTGDQHTWQGFADRYRQIVEYTISQGIIPVLITKADDLESVENTAPAGYINSVIAQMSQDYRVPLLDLRQAVAALPNWGLLPDGFHYNAPPDGQSANFTDDYLDYGFNMRNLTGLQMLDALRRQVLYGVP